MSRISNKKATFEDRFYRKYCCGKINHNNGWAKDKWRNRKAYRRFLKEELDKEIEEIQEDEE